MTVCFTGHRRLEPENISEVVWRLSDRIEDLCRGGKVDFRTGGALGFDTLAALCVLSAKEKFPNARLHLILPCKNQTRGWSDADVEKYEYVLSAADTVTYVSEAYTPYCMHMRNRALVDGSDLCIAYFNKKTGGTAYTVSYAQSKGVEVENIYI